MGAEMKKRRKSNLKNMKISSGLVKNAKNKILKFGDLNEDGKINFKDAGIVYNYIGDMGKQTFEYIGCGISDIKERIDYGKLRPIFVEDLCEENFKFSKLLRVTDIDKKRSNSDVCRGSVGHTSTYNSIDIINIYKENLEYFDLTFYPDIDSEIYYVDPSDKRKYIALDNYFSYLKEVRINELQKIAQDLGAKYFKVTYKEEKASLLNKKVKIDGPKSKSLLDFKHSVDSEKVINVDILAEMKCPGHLPVEPNLKYLKGEPRIESLIELRRDPNSPLSHQKYTLNLGNSIGIKEKDAVKIDYALKAMKLTGNITVASEFKNSLGKIYILPGLFL